MDINKISKIINLVEKTNISEIEVKDDDLEIRITTNNGNNYNMQTNLPSSSNSYVDTTMNNIENINSNAKDNHSSNEESVKSPIVGTFYSAPSPTSSPFVSEGQAVKKGDILCIIEAMKIMNQIESEESGIISKILLKDGDPVECDQPLFIMNKNN